MKNEIVLKNICVSYEDKNVLSNVSFEVKQGLPTCIIGRGASGKTTLLKSIVGLVNTTRGKIFINQGPAANNTDKSIQNNLFGVVFQKDALLRRRTICAFPILKIQHQLGLLEVK